MASAKQIKARKLFAMRAKRGDFRKAIAKSKTRTKPSPARPNPKVAKYKEDKMIIDKRAETSVYITMGNWEVYLDNSTGEHYITSDGIEK